MIDSNKIVDQIDKLQKFFEMNQFFFNIELKMFEGKIFFNQSIESNYN